MKKSLLLSTALVAVFAATQANADIYTWNEDQGTVNISDKISRESGSDTIVWVPGKISVGANSVFSGNKAEIGGAVAIKKLEGALTIGANTQFLNNEATYDGGAVGNYGGAVLTDNVLFKGNKAQTLGTDSNAIGGGAMSLGIDVQTEINNSIFDSNTSGYNGGALGTRKTLQDSEIANANTRNKLNITNSKFTANKALGTSVDKKDSLISSGNGGAIANSFASTVIKGSVFEKNEAKIAAAKEAASAAAPEVAPVVPQTEAMVAKQVYNAIGTRLSGGINSANQGISSGDMLDDAAVWVQGLYNKSKLNNTSKAYGYDADTYGTAFGLEKFVTKSVKLGAGYAYNSTDIDGHNRDTDVHTSTLFAYGEYKPNNWFVNGIASYGWSDYSETKHSTVDVKSKYDVDTFGLQAMTGYEFNLPQAFTLAPEAGVRYARVEQDGYIDDAGQSVKSRNSNIWTGVAGAKLSKAFAADNGMIFKPELRLAAT